MANFTTNYDLKKPLSNEYYNIEDQNENMDIIDQALAPAADQEQVPSGNGPGRLAQWVGWITNRIRAITGKANWYDAPATTLEAANAHINGTAEHGAAPEAAAGRIILRDANGRAQVAAPSAAADIARKDTVDAVQANLAAHAADKLNHVPYAAATGTANTYAVTLSPAPTAYTDGMALCVKINVASTGASTINVNGLGDKTILDSLGNAITAGGLKANTPYTLRYNDTNFIVQGKGGGGNATAADLLSGKTATVDGGPIVGTVPKRGDEEFLGWRRADAFTPSIDGRVHLRIPPGAYLSVNSAQENQVGIFSDDPDFISANFRADKNIFGLQGSMPIIQPNSPPLGVAYWGPNAYGNQYAKVHFLTPAGYCGDGGVWLSQDMPDLLPGNFLATKNIFGQQGSIPVRTNNDTGGSYPQSDADSIYDGQVYLKPPAGYYDGNVWVLRSIPNLTAANIRQGVQIGAGTGGVITGTFNGKRVATGTTQSIVDNINKSHLTVSGLSFRPRLAVSYSNFGSNQYLGAIFVDNPYGYWATNWVSDLNSDTAYAYPYIVHQMSGDGFTLYYLTGVSVAQVKWVAVE